MSLIQTRTNPLLSYASFSLEWDHLSLIEAGSDAHLSTSGQLVAPSCESSTVDKPASSSAASISARPSSIFLVGVNSDVNRTN